MKCALPSLLCLLALTACAGKTPMNPQRAAEEGDQWICRPDADRQGWDCVQDEAVREPAPEEVAASPEAEQPSDLDAG